MKYRRFLTIISIILGCLLLFACTKISEPQTAETETVEQAEQSTSAASPESGFTLEQPPEGMGQPPQGASDRQPPKPPEGMNQPPQGGPDGQPPKPPEGMGQPPQGGPDGQPQKPPEGMGQPPQGSPGNTADLSYSAATKITTGDSQNGKTYTSTAADENALLISTSDSVEICNMTVSKTGNSDGGDNCNFYGLNAAVLCKDGSTVTITGGTVETSASGANGIFCYGGNGGQNGANGDGTTVTISDTTITTSGSGSGGIMTTGGGTTNANNLLVTTSGQSSAPIRTDRGGGTVVINGGVYTSNGLGSPAIYSTAEIAVANATLTSNMSEGVVIEGKNSISLDQCTLTANNTQCNGNASFLDSVMLYQSMSGDADSGTAQFSMNGGSLRSLSGHVFHVTNTNATIELSDVFIENLDPGNILLSVCADGWRGAKNVATLLAKKQSLSGTILVGSDSALTLTLSDGSSFTGAISGNIQNAKGETVSTDVGTVHVTLDASSTWTLTADTYITSFTGDVASIIPNGHALYVNGVKVV